jgi:MFS family permease
MMLGLLVGSFIGGRLGDAFGRKPVMFGALVVLVPSVAAGGIYPNYIAYGILRLVSGSCKPLLHPQQNLTKLT